MIASHAWPVVAPRGAVGPGEGWVRSAWRGESGSSAGCSASCSARHSGEAAWRAPCAAPSVLGRPRRGAARAGAPAQGGVASLGWRIVVGRGQGRCHGRPVWMGGGEGRGAGEQAPQGAGRHWAPLEVVPPGVSGETDDVEGGEFPPDLGPGLSRRWTVVVLCFLAFMLCNMDRVNMSISILPMAEQYGWSSREMGLIQSSFFWGYVLTQVPGGYLADKFGGKNVLAFGVIWWSIATMITPSAADSSLPVLLFSRMAMGVGEGVAMPSMNQMLSKWVPRMERSRALSFTYSGMYAGSMLGLLVSPHLITTQGWPFVFHSFGLLGFVWVAGWNKWAESSPAMDATLDPRERRYILQNTPEQRPVESVPWKLLLSKRATWAIIIAHFCHNWGTFILLTWMPTYYSKVLGMNLFESGFASVLPWLTMAIMANVGGSLADKLISSGRNVTHVRKAMQTIGFLGPAACLTMLSNVTDPRGAVALMMASQGMDAFSQSGLYSNHQDIGPRYSGILLGLSNTAGVLAGVFGTAATGFILESTGSWSTVFGVAVGFCLLGTVVWNAWATGEKVFD